MLSIHNRASRKKSSEKQRSNCAVRSLAHRRKFLIRGSNKRRFAPNAIILLIRAVTGINWWPHIANKADSKERRSSFLLKCGFPGWKPASSCRSQCSSSSQRNVLNVLSGEVSRTDAMSPQQKSPLEEGVTRFTKKRKGLLSKARRLSCRSGMLVKSSMMSKAYVRHESISSCPNIGCW